MSTPRRAGRGRAAVRFNESAWAEDLAAATSAGRAVAETARNRMERDGLDLAELRRCRSDGPESDLTGCAKVYLPDAAGAHSMVLRVALDRDGTPVLAYVAFGLRHPPPGRRLDVYRLAHRRLRG